jgi:hypothetical protein
MIYVTHFARALRIPLATLRNWEQGRVRPDPAARSLLTIVAARQRQMVDHARSTWRVSIRRACRALPVERSTYHYRSRRAGQAQLIERIKEIAATRVLYGYRRIHVLLCRDGWRVNVKRVYRLYREMGLQMLAFGCKSFTSSGFRHLAGLAIASQASYDDRGLLSPYGRRGSRKKSRSHPCRCSKTR